MKKIIISQRIDYLADRNEVRDSLDQSLINLISYCGFIAVPVPNTLICSNSLSIWLTEVQPDAIILSGGNDIGEYLYRDETEFFLLNYAFSTKLPVLGICRGMQLIGIWGGMKLKKVSNHVKSEHKITGTINRIVNSYHNFSLDNVTENFEIIAKSEDNEIEAFKHTNLNWEGWMWHPEREFPFVSDDVLRIRRLFK